MTVSAYLYVNRGNSYGFPYREAISSVAWCDEVIVGTDPRFRDGTEAAIRELQVKQGNIRLVGKEFDYDVPNPHGAIKQRLRDECSGDWLIELDADEYLLQSEVDGIKEVCVHCPPSILVIETPTLHFFNGNWVHRGMPSHRSLISRNVPMVRHDVGVVNAHGRLGAAYLTEKGNKLRAGLRYPRTAVYHYGWYSLPRKWELTRQTLHYYEGRLTGKYAGLADYTRNLDNEEVDFWDVAWRLPLEHYEAAIRTEMHNAPLKRFRGRHPAPMKGWLGNQRVLEMGFWFLLKGTMAKP